jgi:hypothetical protein
VSNGTVTKEELLEALRSSGSAASATLRALSISAFEVGRYESGWNGREILAHLAAIEWTYPRLLEIPVASEDAAAAADRESAPRGGMDGYNARQVEKRAKATIGELLHEFERNREATIAAVEAVGEPVLATPTRSAGGRSGSLGRVFYEVAVLHVQEHVRDIAGGGN